MVVLQVEDSQSESKENQKDEYKDPLDVFGLKFPATFWAHDVNDSFKFAHGRFIMLKKSIFFLFELPIPL